MLPQASRWSRGAGSSSRMPAISQTAVCTAQSMRAAAAAVHEGETHRMWYVSRVGKTVCNTRKCPCTREHVAAQVKRAGLEALADVTHAGADGVREPRHKARPVLARVRGNAAHHHARRGGISLVDGEGVARRRELRSELRRRHGGWTRSAPSRRALSPLYRPTSTPTADPMRA